MKMYGTKLFTVRGRTNDPSSATRRTGGNDCNCDAAAGFAAAHGYTVNSHSYTRDRDKKLKSLGRSVFSFPRDIGNKSHGSGRILAKLGPIPQVMEYCGSPRASPTSLLTKSHGVLKPILVE